MSDDHRPLLTIDLAAVAENYSMLRERVGDAACGASIKADCYGLGMTDVAPALFSAGCRDFFVASLDEAIEARRVMPEAAIHVLFGPARFDRGLYVEHDLIPVLNSLPQIEEWLARSDAEAGRPVILHLDTGMARLGLDTEDVRRLLDDRQILARLNVSLLMSHLACADEPDNEMNRRQLSAFETVRRQMVGSLSTRPRISFANSSGIFLGPEYHFDQVRPGAALYGLNPIPGHPNPMYPVVHLLAPILQVRD
jgi:alanine racemase